MTSSDYLLATALQELTERNLYQRGVLDMLRLLGLITIEDRHGVPTGEVARMVLDSMIAHVKEGVPVSFNWNDLDAEGMRGVDLLRSVEAERLRRTEAGAGRSVRVVQAVIKARRADIDYYLMQYDAHAQQYQPIGGKVDPTDPDAESALRREIAEELGFDAPPDADQCKLSLMKEGWLTTKISSTYGILTEYTFDFYHVAAMRFPIAQTGYTRWLRRGEIERVRADDSRSISTIYLEALGIDALDDLPPSVELE